MDSLLCYRFKHDISKERHFLWAWQDSLENVAYIWIVTCHHFLFTQRTWPWLRSWLMHFFFIILSMQFGFYVFKFHSIDSIVCFFVATHQCKSNRVVELCGTADMGKRTQRMKSQVDMYGHPQRARNRFIHNSCPLFPAVLVGWLKPTYLMRTYIA